MKSTKMYIYMIFTRQEPCKNLVGFEPLYPIRRFPVDFVGSQWWSGK